MKTIIGTPDLLQKIINPQVINLVTNIDKWRQKQEPTWEEYRLGISAAGIFIQVTFAGVMIAVLGLAGGSMLIGTFGMLFAFLANSLAFGQMRMHLVLGFFLLSILVNTSIAIYYAVQLLQ